MRYAIPLVAGLGLALFVQGLPALNRRQLRFRVEPYLNGLGGRPSELLQRSDAGGVRTRLQEVIAPLLPLDSSSVRERLVAAGRDQTVEAFRLDQLSWAAGGGSVGVGAGIVMGGGPRSLLLLLIVGAIGGWAVSDRRLSLAVARRRDAVRQELPVALELLTLSLMAGEAVPQAFARVGQMLPGDTGGEFRRVVGVVRTGVPILDALQELPSRLPGLGSARLVDALCTGIERGAPLAETLRAQADDLRQATRRELLESGGKKEILMLVPVVFLILPTVVAFALLPGLVSLDLLVP